jgi:hypothetical protein
MNAVSAEAISASLSIAFLQASLKAWRASREVRVTPGAAACNFSLSAAVVCFISPQGRKPL